ncbi:hypothetical protein WMY93_008167 [Mugilogobius chulae]|uniref:Reverse transcriptase domain-containing protein n=1 Tax=Mugilogobius chulae TaxID=88201 RepID=A0AAW0PK24_9GOBI
MSIHFLPSASRKSPVCCCCCRVCLRLCARHRPPSFPSLLCEERRRERKRLPNTKPVTSVCHQRIITSTTAVHFANAFTAAAQNTEAAGLGAVPCPNDIVSLFHSTCSDILDSIAPFRRKSSKSKSKPDPWLNEHTRALRQCCRKAERRYNKDKLQVSLEILRESLSNYQTAVREAKCQYLSNIVTNSSNNPRVLFNTIQSVINPPGSVLKNVTNSTCEMFLKYFVEKVALVKTNIIMNANVVFDGPLTPSAVFEVFEPVTMSLLSEIIQGMRPTNCPLDIVPSKVIKQAFDAVGPCLLSLMNSSLSTGTVPTVFKHAVVRPLLKKPNLDPTVLSDFRPVSHLPFLSKVLEKLVFIQLQSFLENNLILEKFQSGFRSRHSTESALLKVHNDILTALDTKKPVMLLMLDLTAAFDTVDHAVLLSRLAQHVGLQGSVLQWFSSYLTDRSFAVMVDDYSSSSAPLTSGVPQGSILGPVLFSIYMLPLGSIIAKYNLSCHLYADDVQLYLPLLPNAAPALDSLNNCLLDIKKWLAHNFLHLNDNKTECIVFGQPDQVTLSRVTFPLSESVRNLGVILDTELSFDKQISAVVRASFLQLRLLTKIKPFLSRNNLEKAVHAFISSRIDYCNALYLGISQSSLHRLQLVQNAAARLLTNSSRYTHITPILSSLHWLPVRFRIDYKILMFVFKALHGLAPPYISDILTLHRPSRALRSSSQMVLDVPRSRYKQWGDRSFAVAAPKLWNSLPVSLRVVSDLSLFKTGLKTHLYRQAFNT